jgi:putative nucleotidyltransferase with HDIG domain
MWGEAERGWQEMRMIPVRFLRAGMRTGRRVYDSQGSLLLNSGITLTDKYIRQLKKLGIESLYIENELAPDLIIEDVIEGETRRLAQKTVQKAYNVFKEDPELKQPSLVIVEKEFASVLDTIIDELLKARELTVDLSDIRTTDDYTFSHSVNVAVLSITAGLSLGLSRTELKEMGVGAFLHDIGKTLTPLSILNKAGTLEQAEMDIIKKHPAEGFNLAMGKKLYSSKSLAVIHQHHERVDGSGYPQGLRGEHIDLAAKICAIVDVYDALTADRPYRRAYPRHKALEIMQAQSEGFHLPAMQAFFQHIPAFPAGTLVGLNDGHVGIVIHNTVGNTTRPRVRILSTKTEYQRIEPFELDLAQSLTLVIDHVYQEEELVEFSNRFRAD